MRLKTVAAVVAAVLLGTVSPAQAYIHQPPDDWCSMRVSLDANGRRLLAGVDRLVDQGYGAGLSIDLFRQYRCAKQAWRWAVSVVDHQGYTVYSGAGPVWEAFDYVLENTDPWAEWQILRRDNTAVYFFSVDRYQPLPHAFVTLILFLGGSECSYPKWYVSHGNRIGLVFRYLRDAWTHFSAIESAFETAHPDWPESQAFQAALGFVRDGRPMEDEYVEFLGSCQEG